MSGLPPPTTTISTPIPTPTPPAAECQWFEKECDNGNCVDLRRLCDDFDDCGDGTDEKDCGKPS